MFNIIEKWLIVLCTIKKKNDHLIKVFDSKEQEFLYAIIWVDTTK